MRTMRSIRWMLASVGVLALTGCVELLGQRIALRYEAASDRLLLLIDYDGIYNNKESEQQKSEDDLRSVVESGDVMLFDWFGYIPLGDMRPERASADFPPAFRALARTVAASVTVHTLGHYRSPSGEIGAAQLVIVERATKLLDASNAAIREAVLASKSAEPPVREQLPRTRALWRQHAADGKDWLAFRGAALEFRCPVHAGEWSQLKHEGLATLLEDVRSLDAGDPFASSMVQLAATAPVSFDQGANEIVARLGDLETGARWRVRWPRTYAGNLEAAVTRHVPVQLDDVLAGVLLNGAVAKTPIAEFLEWGLPEDRVRAVLGVARGAESEQSERASLWLDDFAVGWNAGPALPPAPKRGASIAEWDEWYRAMLVFPAKL